MDRRTTIKWVLAASASLPLLEGRADCAGSARPAQCRRMATARIQNSRRNHQPGELWPLTLNAAQRRLAGILSDIIIPADERSPSASAVGVVDFIDEWVSAPYPAQRRDRTLVLGGFTWMDAEAVRRSGKEFSQLGSRRTTRYLRRHLRRIARDGCTARCRAFFRALSGFDRRRFLYNSGRPQRPGIHRQRPAHALRRTAGRAARGAGPAVNRKHWRPNGSYAG